MAKHKTELPKIPDKRYFSIGEASRLCDVKPYVLRYWEQEFPQINPCKKVGGRRCYKLEDINLIRNIRNLLYFKGFTISGAKRQLKLISKGASTKSPSAAQIQTEEKQRSQMENSISTSTQPKAANNGADLKKTVKQILSELESILDDIKR